MCRYGSSQQRWSMVSLGLMLVVLVVASCSTMSNPVAPPSSAVSPTAPQPAASGQPLTIRPEAFSVLTLGPARDPHLRPKPVATTQHIVAATGGTVSLSGTLLLSSYRYSLTIPPGALTQDTDISISVPDDSQILMDLGPHGQAFTKPVTFQMQVGMADLGLKFGILKKTLDVYWYNDATGLWDGQRATISKQGSDITATVPLAHFSRYSLGGNDEAF